MALYFRAPFPEDNIFLRVMAIRSASAFLFLKYSYTLFLYTTPYLVYSILLSGVYIFALKTGRRIRAGKLPLYSDPRKRTELSLVVGEVHHPRKQVPSETPRWLVIPERGLFTGIAIVGAVPLKNRNRSYAGSALPEDYARRTVTKAQAQLIQSNCPSATKNLNAVARRRVSDRKELSVLPRL